MLGSFQSSFFLRTRALPSFSSPYICQLKPARKGRKKKETLERSLRPLRGPRRFNPFTHREVDFDISTANRVPNRRFQIGKGVRQSCILSPCLFNLYAEYIMRNTGLESRLPGEISITSDMQMTPPLWQKVKKN